MASVKRRLTRHKFEKESNLPAGVSQYVVAMVYAIVNQGLTGNICKHVIECLKISNR